MRTCAQCGKRLTSTRSTAKFCSTTCRTRAAKGRQKTARQQSAKAAPPGTDGPIPTGDAGLMLAATVTELTEAERLKTSHGAAAVALANRIDQAQLDTGSAYAALVREWRATMDVALAGARRRADVVDELSKRRERRRAGT